MNLVSDDVLDQMKSLKNASVMIDNHWLRPASVNDVLDCMKQFPKYFIRQGGTGGYKKFQKQDHDVVIDISAVDDLKNISVEDDCLTIGSGATFTNIIKYLKTLTTTDSIIAEMLRVITNLGSPQVRNVASLGGSLLWNHPASDLTPLLLAAGAELEIMDTDRDTRTVSLTDSSSLQPGHLLISVHVPLNKKQVKFFKHARRSTADLAIANLALSYNTTDDTNKITDVEVWVGGIGLAVKYCPQRIVKKTENIEKMMMNNSLDKITTEMICDAVEADLAVSDEHSDLEKTAFRVSLVTGFLIKFIESVKSGAGLETEKRSYKSHQLFDKTPADQPVMDPVTRPLPHISSAEQCSGEAVYVDDLPTYQREVSLYPVQVILSSDWLIYLNAEV